ncbi:MAG: hypothetical protein LWX07_01255 [Bacteroidetes bacterium]|nr:hypothetical protein [Bacteroidota bacterium]
MKQIFAAILFVFTAISCFAQVTVAPVTVHMSDADKNSYIVVRNNSSNSSWEVSIEMKFGYPVSDSLGKTVLYFPEKENETDPSAVKFISFYPRKFILPPLGEQTVRISAKPKGLTDGEYWGRPVIKSKVVAAEDSTGKENINAGLGVEFRTVIALNYRKGKVSTGVNIQDLKCSYDGSKLILTAGLKRDGNAAYIGNIITSVTDSKDNEIKNSKQEISVYYDLNKRIEIETGKLAPGKYNISVSLNTDREEPGSRIIKGNTAERKIILTVN